MVRRVRRNSWRKWLVTLSVLVFLVVRAWYEQQTIQELPRTVPHSSQGTLSPGEYRVLRVVDGDTLLLEHARTRVRLQGIDTPETVKENTAIEDWGPEASQYTKRFVNDAGGRVRLEIDGEAVDRYGRQLVFVWHDGRLLNEELVREGLARAKLAYDYSEAKKQRLRRAEDEAQAAQRGIWSRR